MPQNFGSNFLRGFGTTFSNTFDTSLKYGLKKQEEDALKQKTLEYQKKQNDILSQLIHNVTVDPKSFQGGMPLIRPLTPEEQFQGYAQLSPQNQNTFEFILKQRESNKPKTIRVNDTWYKEDPNQPGVPIGEPIWKPSKNEYEGTDFVDATTVPGLERFKGYTIRQQVWRNDKGEITRRGKFDTNPFKPIFKEGSQDGSGGIIDLNADEENFAKFNALESKYSVDMAKYLNENDKIDVGGENINRNIDKTEVIYYNKMLPDAREYVNKEFYSIMPKSDYDEYKDREILDRNFKEGLNEDFHDGTLEKRIDWKKYPTPKGMDEKDWRLKVTGKIYKRIDLWRKLKFKRL